MAEAVLSEIRYKELKALERYKKGLAPAPFLYRPDGYLLKASPSQEQPMVFVVSEESEDRMGDIIKADGWDLENFKANAPFLYAHDEAFPPIGTWPKIWTEGKQLLASPKWDEEDDFALLLKGKYQRGVMRGVSVGFLAIDFEERAYSEMGRHHSMVFNKVELVEISAVPVPAHPRALKKALGNRSYFWIPAYPEAAVPETPIEPEISPGELHAMLKQIHKLQEGE